MEIWKDIPNYEQKYQVSNLGRVKSLNYRRSGIEQILKTTIGENKYETLTLSNNGKDKTFKVYILIAITFLNHVPNGYNLVIDHIDSNKLNNNVENLKIVTHRENIQKELKIRSGLPSGVSFNNKQKCFMSSIKIKEKHYFLGKFNCPTIASDAYQTALTNFTNSNILPKTIEDKKTSKEKYIYYHKQMKRWVYCNKKVFKNTISFLTEEEAITHKNKVEITFDENNQPLTAKLT